MRFMLQLVKFENFIQNDLYNIISDFNSNKIKTSQEGKMPIARNNLNL